MKTVTPGQSRLLAATAMALAAVPAAAADGMVVAQAGIALVLWLGTLALVLLLMRHRANRAARIAELEALLCLERQARSRSEQALGETHGVLCRLVREQAGVRDAERGRIGRDIHDDLGQTLLTLRIELSMLQLATSGIHPAINLKLGGMASTLDAGLRALRSVIHNLRPLALAEGLRGAILRQLAEFTRLYGVTHELVAADDAFDDTAGADELLYRVLQEALSNVARHAQASHVRVLVERSEAGLGLRVEDDGVGLPDAAQTQGSGLAGMRERARAAGGELHSGRRQGGGTVLALELPLLRRTVIS